MKKLGVPIILMALILAACGSAQENTLGGSSWQLESMPSHPDLGPVEVSLNFDEEGAIGGVGGCNNYGGSYALSGTNGIRFSEIFSTMLFCEENDASETEAAYLEALSQAQSYALDNESLRIQTGLGKLVFSVAP